MLTTAGQVAEPQHRRHRAATAVVLAALVVLTSFVVASPARAACAAQPIGAIKDKWIQLGGEGGPLGCPEFAGERTTPDGIGRYTHFQRGGSIYWTSSTGAHSVWGEIRKKWEQKGWETVFGYPTTDELTTPDGVGRFNHFSRNASIYWTPNTGAHSVQGQIKDRWAFYGWETALGYPLTDEIAVAGGAYSRFEFGTLHWTPSGGVNLGSVREQAVAIANGQVGRSEANRGCEIYGPCLSYDWCAMFVNWVWRQAGVNPFPTGWVATEEGVWGKQLGRFHRGRPVPGDLAVYGEPGSGTGGHVSIVVAVNANGTIVTVDGNVSNQVLRRTINPATQTAGSRGVRISGYVSPPNA
jgi:uncharacterized protein with LGFP repeats